jgi:hypothetical protein
MAHFAEIDENNVVIRVLTACNQDIANNGGELSEQAATYFQSYTPLSSNGVKYIQTSYNHNFRGRFAGVGMIYKQEIDKFILPKPYASWTLDENGVWQAPVAVPTILLDSNNKFYNLIWDESNQKWISTDSNNTSFEWDTSTFSWKNL